MPPEKSTQSWAEINKSRREAKRKRKEEKLSKEPTVKKVPKTEKIPELPTLSIAVPGSILETAQSPELRSYLAGQIARAACIFQVDEIVIFDDYSDENNAKTSTIQDNYGEKTIRDSCAQFGRILQYLECPQYLRKQFFPIHSNLKYCGLLNPLNAPHHLTRDEHSDFREGVVVNKPIKEGQGSIVNVGLLKEVHIDKVLTTGLRCTVKLNQEQASKHKLRGVVVSPSAPRNEAGLYWGYTVRMANSLSRIFTQSPYQQGYDLTIGTSDKGTSVVEFVAPEFQHALVVFGGVQGLELALETDPELKEDEPSPLFNYYLNTAPNQGSKTIRTEEAILISLSALRPKLKSLFK